MGRVALHTVVKNQCSKLISFFVGSYTHEEFKVPDYLLDPKYI